MVCACASSCVVFRCVSTLFRSSTCLRPSALPFLFCFPPRLCFNNVVDYFEQSGPLPPFPIVYLRHATGFVSSVPLPPRQSRFLSPLALVSRWSSTVTPFPHSLSDPSACCTNFRGRAGACVCVQGRPRNVFAIDSGYYARPAQRATAFGYFPSC